MSENQSKLEVSIAVILEKVSALPEIKQDIKDLRGDYNKLHTMYIDLKGSLSAYADIKHMIDDVKHDLERKTLENEEEIKKITNKIYYFSGASAVVGMILGAVLGNIV